jgi:phosphonate transport system substrate-binding protein
MKPNKLIAISIYMLAIAGLDLLNWTGPREAAAQQQGVISIGSISLEPRKEINRFQPFVDYLAGQLGAAGISSGRVFLAGSMEEMAGHIRQGRVDIYIDSPFPVSKVMEISGAKPFLRRWKKGQGEYHSVIFVRKDSEIDGPRGLKGKMVAFDEPFSSSGYFLPKATLMEAGLALMRYDDPSSKVASDKVGYVFTHDDDNTMSWVLEKKVWAGAVDNGSFPTRAGKRIDELKVISKSIDVPRQVVAHRANLNPKLLSAIEKALLTMDQDDKGRAALREFEKTTKFDRFPEGPEKTFESIKRVAGLVDK